MSQRLTQRIGVLRVLVALVAVALVAASCDDGGGESSAPDESDPAAGEVLGETDPATGEPLVVGFAVDTGGEAVDTEETKIAAAATADYVNEYLNGIEGRPLELVFCDTENTAAVATECVNSFVQDGVSVIMTAVSGNGESIATAAAAAGIPYVTLQGNSFPEFIDPNSFSMSGNALGVLLAPAGFMEAEGLTDLAILTIDVPAATQAVDALAKPAYEAAGLSLELITAAPGTADLSAGVTAGGDPDVWLVLGDAAFCTTALQALQVQAPDTPVFMTQQCVAPDIADSLPNGYTGVTTIASTRLDPEDPEAVLFDAVLETFADEDLSAAAPGFLADGFSTVLGFDHLMEGYDGDGGPDSVTTYLSTATGELPLAGGVVMDCGNPPIAALSSVCSLSAWLTVRDAAGEGVSFEQIDVTPYVAL